MDTMNVTTISEVPNYRAIQFLQYLISWLKLPIVHNFPWHQAVTLKVGYPTDSRCQRGSACLSSFRFEWTGATCLGGGGLRVGEGPSQDS